MASKVGKNCKVMLGSNVVLGIGDWRLSGISADMLEDTAFGDEWKKFKFGMKDGGTISFSGQLHPDDADGQLKLMEANLEGSQLTDLRLYVDNTSYFEPCQTTGYFNPSVTSGAGTQLSYVNITSFDISSDKSGLLNVSFEGKVSGVMVLV